MSKAWLPCEEVHPHKVYFDYLPWSKPGTDYDLIVRKVFRLAVGVLAPFATLLFLHGQLWLKSRGAVRRALAAFFNVKFSGAFFMNCL